MARQTITKEEFSRNCFNYDQQAFLIGACTLVEEIRPLPYIDGC